MRAIPTVLVLLLAVGLGGGWLMIRSPVQGQAAQALGLTGEADAQSRRAPASAQGGDAVHDTTLELEALRDCIDRAALVRLEARLLDAVASDGNNGFVHADLSEAARMLGHVERAVTHGKRAVELVPDSSRAHHVHAKALGERMRTGGLWAAMRDVGTYKKEVATAIALDRNNTRARSEQIAYLIFAPSIAGGDVEEARRLARELEVDDLRRARLMLVLSFAMNEDVDRAITTCEATLEELPGDQSLHATLASLLLEEGRMAEAAVHLDAVLAGPTTDDYYRAMYQRSRARVMEGVELEEALADLETYIAAEPYGDMLPSLAGAHWRMGMAHELQGRRAEARSLYETALQLDPDLEEAQDSLDDLD